MQFQLRTLLIFTTLAAVICGTFVAPPMVAVPVLTLILWTSPAFWLTSALYYRGQRQAFFIGATLAGIVPYLTAVILSIVYYAEWIDDGDLPDRFDRASYDPSAPYRLALAVYLPGVCSLIGGSLGWLSHRLALRARAQEGAPTDESIVQERSKQA
jgi:hypothetical protein